MIELLHILATSPSVTNPPITQSQIQGLPMPQTAGVIQQVLGIVFGVIGAVALLIVTVSGLRYILSSGDPQKTARAKDGIIYSLVGLAVALAAESIVYFVAGRL